MLTMNMTVGAEKDIIWVYKIDMDTSFLYFSTEWDKITLDAVDFDGKVILKDSISTMEEGIVGDGINGGNISIVSNHSFSIARYNTYTGTANFFNDFYPQTSKPLLTAKDVHVGICWRGATTLAEITWIKKYKIQEVKTYYNKIDCFCVEEDELSATQLPPYVIQNKFDNGISYFSTLPDDRTGQIIPIVYGDFSSLDLAYENYSVVPTVPLIGNDYLIASHICHTVDASNQVYMYKNKVETLMEISAGSPTNANSRAGHRLTMTSRGEKLTGKIKIIPRGYLGTPYGGTDLANAIDKSSTSYATISPNTIAAFKFGTDFSRNELGEFSGILGENILKVLWDANGGSVDLQIKYYHPQMGSNSGYSSLVLSATRSGTGYTENYEFGQGNYDYGSNPKKFTDTAEWDEEELQVLHFDILNLVTSAGSMRVKHLYFDLQNLSVYFTPKGASLLRDNASGGRGTPEQMARQKLRNYIDENEIYASVKGYIYDGWID